MAYNFEMSSFQISFFSPYLSRQTVIIDDWAELMLFNPNNSIVIPEFRFPDRYTLYSPRSEPLESALQAMPCPCFTLLPAFLSSGVPCGQANARQCFGPDLRRAKGLRLALGRCQAPPVRRLHGPPALPSHAAPRPPPALRAASAMGRSVRGQH